MRSGAREVGARVAARRRGAPGLPRPSCDRPQARAAGPTRCAAPSTSAPRKRRLRRRSSRRRARRPARRAALDGDRARPRPSAGAARPGTYSSRTAWKLVPPKPNALTPARRTPPAGAPTRAARCSPRRASARSRCSGLGASKWRLGGSTLWCSASTALSSPAAPAAPLRWPMFDFTEPSAIEPGARPEPPKPSRQALDLDHVADAGRGAVALDQRRRSRATARRCCQARSTASRWPTGFGAVMPLPRAVARAADAAEHGVDAVAVALGVGQALEQEQRRALAHHEAVGAVGVRPRAGRRQRADLAELHEGRRAHVAVDAAGDGRRRTRRRSVPRPPRSIAAIADAQAASTT